MDSFELKLRMNFMEKRKKRTQKNFGYEKSQSITVIHIH